MTPRPCRPARWWAAALLSTTLAGCSAIPEQSPVEQGPALDQAPRQEVSVEVEPPPQDATPEQVVTGFLRTGIDDTGDHRVGREYLTDAASASWEPGARVLVQDQRAGQGVTALAGDTVRVNLAVLGEVDASGRLTEAAPGERADLTFGLEQVDGQWRIDSLPSDTGIVLSQADFQRLYQPVDVHWGSPVSEELVPQRRWLRSGEGMTSALGRLQTEPVPRVLEGAVSTGVPAGTRLETAAVPVSDGTAVLRLSDTMVGADPAQRNLAWAQYAATMRQLPGVDAVSLFVGGNLVDAESDAVGERLSYPQGAGYSVVSVVVLLLLLHQRQALQAADPGSAELEPLAQPQELRVPSVPSRWDRMAVSADFRTVAAVDGRVLGVWREGALTTYTARGELSVPSMDPLGFLWTTQGQEEDTEVLVLDTSRRGGRPESLSVPWLGDEQVVQVRMSPDGARALVVLRGGGRDRVAVVGVVRGPGGEPTSLTEPRPIAPQVGGVQDLAWIDEHSVALLGTPGPDGEQKVWRSELGGWTELQGSVDNAVAVAAYPDEREDGLLVTTEGGRVLTKAGATWFVANVASEVVVPGR